MLDLKLCHGRLSKNLKEEMKEGRESAVQETSGRNQPDSGPQRNFGSIITHSNEYVIPNDSY